MAALQHVWSGTAGRDTAVMVDLLLRNDWTLLDPTGTAVHDGTRVPGVGVVLPSGPEAEDGARGDGEPVTRFPLHQAAALDIAWIYLIDPDTATVAVHTGDGELARVHPLDAARHSRQHAMPTPAGGHRRRRIVRRHAPPRQAGWSWS